MALLPWDDEQKKKDELFSIPIKTVASVQSGSWQPAPSGADSAVATEDSAVPKTSGSIFDQAQAQPQPSLGNYLLSDEKARVDEQKRKRDAEIEAARQQEAARQAAIAAENFRRSQIRQNQEQQQQQQATAPNYLPVQKEGGWKGFLKGVGAGIEQDLSKVADVVIKGGGLVDYAGRQLFGASGDAAAAQSVSDADKVRNWLFSKKDITGRNLQGTKGVEDAASRIQSGNGSLRDFASLAGESLQVGIDSTMFLNPARLAAGAGEQIAKPVITQSANILAKTAASPVVRYAMRDAAFFGGLQGTATFQRVYGETGDVTQALEAAAKDAIIGGVLQGTLDIAGHGIGVGANRTLNSLRRGDKTPTVDINSLDRPIEGGVQAAEAKTPTTPAPEQAPAVADGIARPSDSNISFERPAQTPDLSQNPEVAPTADGVVTPTPTDVAPASDVPAQTPNPIDAVTPTPDIPPVQPATVSNVAPVADGVIKSGEPVPITDKNVPVIPGEQTRALQEAIPGKSQAEEAAINQKLQEIKAQSPQVGKTVPAQVLPEGIAPVRAENLPEGDFAPAKASSLSPDQQARQEVADIMMRSTSIAKEMKGKLARSLDMAKDTETDVRTLLKDGGVEGKRAERITGLFQRAEEISKANAKTQIEAQRRFVEGGTPAMRDDGGAARARNVNTREEQVLATQLNSEIKKLGLRGDKAERLVQGLENVVQGRSANMLIGSPLEKSWTADILGTARDTIKNPVQMVRAATQHGNIVNSAVESQTRTLRDMPKSFTEGYKNLTGGVFQALMTPAHLAASVRVNAARTQLVKKIYRAKIGKELSSADAESLGRNMGNDINALTHMAAGVDNGTFSDLAYRRALKKFNKFLESGEETDWKQYVASINKQSSLAQSIMRGIESMETLDSKVGQKTARALKATFNGLFPFMRNATNMTTKTFTRDLNPFARSILDEIRVDQMGATKKLTTLLSNNAVNYGVLAALSSVLEYNDGSDAGKPRGVSIHLGGDNYFAVRGTPVELPLALTLAARSVVEDVGSGESEKPEYYFGMIKSSIPYVDQMQQNSGVVSSIGDVINQNEEGDSGYAARAFGVNLGSSATPFANNNLQAWWDRNNGKSTDVKKTYDKNPFQWYWNKLQDRGLGIVGDRSKLPNSYDLAGRVRTVDTQGAVINKTINDANTAEFNDRLTDLVHYGRQNGFGKNVQDMFNTYDTGKNNNFKSIQDTITFLDAPEVDGKTTPDNAKKLEKNKKLADLAQQIRDGFYGDKGNELLTLDGQNLYSDVSVPNKNGTKNSKLPLSIQSIKNAIAQTDLPEADRNKIYEISKKNDALYSQFKAKNITYDQYSAEKAKNEQTYTSILSGSKSYKKMLSLFNELDQTGFFNADGLGSTRSGQTYLWNSLNALLGSKGATPAANYPDTSTFKPWGRGGGGTGRGATNKPGDRGNTGIKWTPVGKRQAAQVVAGKYTPVNIKVKLGNAVKKDRSQNYADRSF